MKKGFEKQLDVIIKNTMDAQGIPGLSLCVVEKGKTIYSKGFGVKNIESGEAVTDKTLFHMASITKTFTAAAVMQLFEEGKIELNSPVVKYLPYFKLDDERYKEITIHQMLTHTSGMPDEEDYNWDKPEYDEEALERYVRGLESLKLIDGPGMEYSYSNIAYEVLGDLVSKVSGMSFEEYIQSFILAPLEMDRSTLLFKEADKSLMAGPHVLNEDGEISLSTIFPYNRAHAPSSTMYSNIEDMAKYALSNLCREKMLDRGNFDMMFKPHVATGSDYEFDLHRGLSWAVGTYREHETISHRGQDTGFISNLVLVPGLSLAVILMINFEMAVMPLRIIPSMIIDMALGYEPFPLFTDIENMESFSGTYINKEGSSIEVEVTNKDAFMSYKGRRYRMIRDVGDVLVYYYEGSQGFSLAILHLKGTGDIKGPYMETSGNILFGGTEDFYILKA